jgi:hypothetical protein
LESDKVEALLTLELSCKVDVAIKVDEAVAATDEAIL